MSRRNSGPKVRLSSDIPRQQKTSTKLRKAADYRVMQTIKHPHRSEFHSYSEYLYAGLQEGSPRISRYVPQAFSMRINGKGYVPDVFIDGLDGPMLVEIKPRGEFNDELRIPLEHFCKLKRWRFEVVSNESILERCEEAESWLEITRTLYIGKDHDTTREEWELTRFFAECPDNTALLGELIDRGDRESSFLRELATFRLLHRGTCTSDLAEAPLDFTTRVTLCD